MALARLGRKHYFALRFKRDFGSPVRQPHTTREFVSKAIFISGSPVAQLFVDVRHIADYVDLNSRLAEGRNGHGVVSYAVREVLIVKLRYEPHALHRKCEAIRILHSQLQVEPLLDQP
jgi:hypothetical protein